MKERILRLCKRLNKFTLNEISTISEIKQEDLLPVLNEFVKLNRLIKDDDTYIYKRVESEKRARLPQIFMYHSNQEIDYIIRGFCSDVEVKKMITPAQMRMIEGMWREICYCDTDYFAKKSLRKFLKSKFKIDDIKFLTKRKAVKVIQAIKGIQTNLKKSVATL